MHTFVRHAYLHMTDVLSNIRLISISAMSVWSFTQVIGWENIELISDRPLETMLDEFKRLKEEYPDR